ncbi:MAG: separin protein, partial [Marteilia pararefringens]
SQILACGHSSVIKRDFCRLFAAALYCKGELKRCIDYLLISLDIPASADIPPSESHSNSKIDTGDKSFPHSVDIYSLQRLLKDDHQIIGFIDLSSDNLHFKTEKNFYYIFYFKISKSNFEVKRFEDKRLLNINSNIIKIRSEISQSTKRLEKDQVQNYVYRLNESLDDNIRDFESILIENRIFISHTMDKSHEGFKNKILSDIDPIISQEVAPILSHIIANYHRMDGHILTKILSKYFSDCQLKEIRDYMKSKDLFSVSKLRSDHTHLFISSHLLYFPFESISTLRYQQCSRYISPNHFINCMKNKKFEIGDLYYLINPDGTLEKCQKRITDFLKNINTSIALKGHTGRLMDSDEINLNNELQKNQYFVYCGHGDGQRYLRKPVDFSHIKDITASMFLFGCSSLYCEPVSYFDAYGLVINLIRKNCPLLGGFLWHIFDRDSDLFTIKLLKSILEGDSKSVYDACLQAKSSDNYKCLNTASFVIYGYLF